MGVIVVGAIDSQVTCGEEATGLPHVTLIAEFEVRNSGARICRFSEDGAVILFAAGDVGEIRLSSGEIRVLGQTKHGGIPFQQEGRNSEVNSLFQNHQTGAVCVSSSLCDSRHCRHQDVAVESFDGNGPPILLWDHKVIADPIVDASPDGSRIAVAAEGKVRLFSPRFGQPIREFEAKRGIGSIGFSPDSALLAMSAGMTEVVSIFEVKSGRLVKELRFPDADIRSVAYSPDGGNVLAIGNKFRAVFSVDIQTGVYSARLSSVRATGLIPIPNSRVVAIVTVDKGMLLRTAGALAGNARIDCSSSDVIAASADGRRLAIWKNGDKLSVYSLEFADAPE